MKRFLDDNFVKTFSHIDSHRWQLDKFWNEDCDIILKRYIPIIKELYKKYSGRYALPGRPKYVSMDEFIQMVTDGQVVDDKFGSREIGILYNQSMFTQVDEIDDDRHTKMGLDEFMDAIGRVADRLAVASPYDESKAERTAEQLAKLPTFVKLKNFIEILLKLTLRKDFVDMVEKKIMGIKKTSSKIDPDLAFKIHREAVPDKTLYSVASSKGTGR